jgi:ribonuclease HI
MAGKVVASETITIPFSTNFEAEYRSIIEALKYLSVHKQFGEAVILYNDNATVISQILGKARIFEPRLKVLYDEVVSYVASYKYKIQFEWVEKKGNKAHDLFER